MILSKPGERLYLKKDRAQNISVDLPITLPQHQIDGIRFLYRQFEKKAPGVILNDPSGYGKCLQVVLFLNALRPVLKKPILILSNSVDNWKQHFETWTNCSDELSVCSANPFTKKQMFINPVGDGPAFSRRSWAVVVLHDEQCSRPLLDTRFTADYNIWVTSHHLKEDLHTLSSIYEWLHPNQKFNVNLFIPREGDLRDVVKKALLLDACLEDFLIRRTDFLTPFMKPEKPKPPKPSPVKVTRKNKDPTGTKVKRSKRRIIEDDDDDDITNVNVTVGEKNSHNNTTKDVSVSDDTDYNMDVESFIRNEKPIESEGFNFILNETSQESMTVTVKVTDSMDIDFREVKDIVENEKTFNNSKDKDFNVPNDSSSVKEMEKNAPQKTLETNKIDGEEIGNGVIVPATEDSDSQQSIFDHETAIQNYDYNKKGNANEKNGVTIPETENSENSNEMFKIEARSLDVDESSQSNSKDWKINDKVLPKNDNLVSKDKSDVSKSIKTDGNEGGASNDNTNFKSNDIVKKKSKIDEFDEEMAELEAKALKRFKGSILDSFF